VLARIRAALRRAVPAIDTPVIRSASFTVDLAARRAVRDGEEAVSARITRRSTKRRT